MPVTFCKNIIAYINISLYANLRCSDSQNDLGKKEEKLEDCHLVMSKLVNKLKFLKM